jgi:hypothetical protein
LDKTNFLYVKNAILCDLMRIFCLLCILSLSAPVAYAYPEYPPFEQTQFADDFGMFRWWNYCWWRVFDPDIYVLCYPDGSIFLQYPDGRVIRASQEDIERLFAGRGRRREGRGGRVTPRLGPALGDGFRLSDVYGGRFFRFDGNSGLGRFNLPSGTGVFRFDRFGNPITGDFGGRDSGDEDDDSGSRSSGSSSSTRFGGRSSSGSNGSWRFSGDGSGGRFSGTRMHDIFYEPLGLYRCDSIHDSIDGGIFGPIPCTSYPGVFGPKVEFGRTN